MLQCGKVGISQALAYLWKLGGGLVGSWGGVMLGLGGLMVGVDGWFGSFWVGRLGFGWLKYVMFGFFGSGLVGLFFLLHVWVDSIFWGERRE